MARQLTGVVALGIGTLVGMSLIATAQNDSGSKRVATPPRPKSLMKPFMHGKLDDFQLVMTSLVKRDFEQLEKASRSLRSRYVSRPDIEGKQEFDDKVYEHFGLEFMRLAGKLTKMAEEENLEGATFYYQDLTATCISCHEHLRDERPTRSKVRHAGAGRRPINQESNK